MGEKKVAIKIMSKTNKNGKNANYNEEKVRVGVDRFGWRSISYQD